MSRSYTLAEQVVINYAKLTGDIRVPLAAVQGGQPGQLTATAEASYIVGQRTSLNNEDTYRDIPTATTNGHVSLPVPPGTVNDVVLADVIKAICAAEGLDPTQGDHIIAADGVSRMA